MSRAMRRVASMGATQVVRRVSQRTGLKQKLVRARTRHYQSAGEAIVRVVSDWISLYEIGATQTARGVTVSGRGSYAHAFIVERYKGVYRRAGKARLPIRQLYGPNPAHDIDNNPEVYDDLLAEVAEKYVLPRLIHELG